MDYLTEMCVEDRLKSIEEQYPEHYDKVVANIISTKILLKEGECYKPHHVGKNPQGGLGGVGVENWILQHGVSFYDAAESFMEVANECESFEDFQSKYQIWDFGKNHMVGKHNHSFDGVDTSRYPYDNFVAYNMNSDGYEKMKVTLSKYLETTKVAEVTVNKDKSVDDLIKTAETDIKKIEIIERQVEEHINNLANSNIEQTISAGINL